MKGTLICIKFRMNILFCIFSDMKDFNKPVLLQNREEKWNEILNFCKELGVGFRDSRHFQKVFSQWKTAFLTQKLPKLIELKNQKKNNPGMNSGSEFPMDWGNSDKLMYQIIISNKAHQKNFQVYFILYTRLHKFNHPISK